MMTSSRFRKMKNTQLETGPETDHQSTGMLIHVACQQNQTVRQGVLEFGLRLSRRLRSWSLLSACRQRLDLSRLNR